MTQSWEPETWYDHGAVVVFEGHKYRVIQPTTRRSADSTPPVNPAFWGGIPDDGGEKPTSGAGSDEQKELEISGGLPPSANAFGRGFSGRRWDRNEEKRQAWSMEDWLRESEQRTRDYWASGPRGPATWILVEGRNIPDGAIIGGEEHGQYQYICRAWHEGSLQVGKACSSFKFGGIIGYENKEQHVSKYEVLVGDMRALCWKKCEGRLNLAVLPGRPLEGGREADGTPLFIAKAPYRNAHVPGKCSERHSGALIPYDNQEKEIRSKFYVLCYA
ncbi:hypothetical protein V8D89_009481 [Ganoderma adspersum]